jgi:hypothetical protein
MPICSGVFPTVSCSCFKILGHILSSFIHFELILVQGERQGSSFNLLHMDIQFSQQHLLKRLSFLHVLGSFIKNHLAVAVWVCVWVFYSNPLVCIVIIALLFKTLLLLLLCSVV